jgi:hypothetical protein
MNRTVIGGTDTLSWDGMVARLHQVIEDGIRADRGKHAKA